MNLFYTLVTGAEMCANLKPILGIVGWVLWGIKIIVPIVLIVVGMIDMTKAIAGKDEDTIKKAQKALGKKAIAAVVVFLIATMVGIIMSLVGGQDYKEEGCNACLNSPWDCPINSEI